jgi:hypothetical protein
MRLAKSLFFRFLSETTMPVNGLPKTSHVANTAASSAATSSNAPKTQHAPSKQKTMPAALGMFNEIDKPGGHKNTKFGKSAGGAASKSPDELRPNVTQTAAEYAAKPGASYYPHAVHLVSQGLQDNKFGITQSSHDGVIGNLQGLHEGSQHLVGAHMTESVGFGKDALKHAMNGEFRDGAMTAAGSVLNAAASMTAAPAHMFDSMRKSDKPEHVAAALSSHTDFGSLAD